MQSDFSTAGKTMREAIFVPNVPISAILQRSAETNMRDRLRAIFATAVFGLGLASAGVVGAKIFADSQAWLSGDKMALKFHDFVMISEPTHTDLSHLVKSATFPIVFPVGLPGDSRVLLLGYSSTQHPSIVAVSYKGVHSGFNANFLIFDEAVVNATGMPTDSGFKLHGPVLHWRVGREIVVLPTADTHFSNADLVRIQGAMGRATSAASVAETGAMLPNVVAIGVEFRLDAAEKLRAPSGVNVLLDWGELHHIADEVARQQPVMDWRVREFSNVQFENGLPSYRGLTPAPLKTVAVSYEGARAIDAVLAYANVYRKRCNCEMLFNQPNSRTYSMWLIPLTGKAAIHYRVDASTMKVSQI